VKHQRKVRFQRNVSTKRGASRSWEAAEVSRHGWSRSSSRRSVSSFSRSPAGFVGVASLDNAAVGIITPEAGCGPPNGATGCITSRSVNPVLGDVAVGLRRVEFDVEQPGRGTNPRGPRRSG